MTSAVTLVLVHGAWHGPWCWQLLMEQLTGVEVRAVPLSSSGNDPSKLGDLYEDAEIVRSAVGDVEGLVVVCAHSYGGAPVTEILVGVRKVGRLVYLCAWQLDVGEPLLCARQVVPPPWWTCMWREIPSTYVICEKDSAIPPAVQQRMARRAHRVERLNTSHSHL